MMRAGFIVSRSCRWGKQFDKLGLTNGRKSLPQLLYAQVVKTVRRHRLVRVRHRVVCGTLEAVQQVLAVCGWQINTAFIERVNLSIRQHVAAVGRRVSTLCKGEEGLRQQLGLYHVYYNFCCNRSAYENRGHAAACAFWWPSGSRDGASSPHSAASCAAVR